MNFPIFLINCVSILIEVYVWIIIARVFLSFIRPRSYNPIFKFIYQITEPFLAFFRRFLPGASIGIDFSPFVAIIILEILKQILISLFLRLFA